MHGESPTQSLKTATQITSRSLCCWEEIRTPPPHPSRRSYHSAAVWRNKLIIIGGQDMREGPQHGVWILTLSTGAEPEFWEMVPVEEIGALYRASALVRGDSLYLFGGTNGNVEYNRVLILDLNTKNWQQVVPSSPVHPPPLDSHTASLHEN